jgi:hypothetical protein
LLFLFIALWSSATCIYRLMVHFLDHIALAQAGIRNLARRIDRKTVVPAP